MKPLVSILLLALSVSAQSTKEGKKLSDWTFVSESPFVKSYYAPESVRRNADVIKVWMRFELPQGSKDLYADTPIDFGEARMYGLLKCEQKQMQMKTMLVYDRQGQFFAGKENFGEWETEKPDSIGHSIFLYFCERGKVPTVAPTLKPK